MRPVMGSEAKLPVVPVCVSPFPETVHVAVSVVVQEIVTPSPDGVIDDDASSVPVGIGVMQTDEPLLQNAGALQVSRICVVQLVLVCWID